MLPTRVCRRGGYPHPLGAVSSNWLRESPYTVGWPNQLRGVRPWGGGYVTVTKSGRERGQAPRRDPRDLFPTGGKRRRGLAEEQRRHERAPVVLGAGRAGRRWRTEPGVEPGSPEWVPCEPRCSGAWRRLCRCTCATARRRRCGCRSPSTAPAAVARMLLALRHAQPGRPSPVVLGHHPIGPATARCCDHRRPCGTGCRG